MFSREGARVAIIDIQEQAAQDTVEQIRLAGGEAHFFQADVSKADQVDRAFDAIRDRVGPYDVLFNHAGTIIVKPLHESTEEDYDRLMDINVRSAFLVCRRALPEMVANGGGSVVITASIASELGYALEALYCMSKGAVLQLARTISVEYRERGIRCNAVCPGFDKTAHGLREIAELDAAGQAWKEGDLTATQGRICANPKRLQLPSFSLLQRKPASSTVQRSMSTTVGMPRDRCRNSFRRSECPSQLKLCHYRGGPGSERSSDDFGQDLTA